MAMRKSFITKLCFIILIISLVGCSGSNSSLSSGNTGSIAAKLDWSGVKTSSILKSLGIHSSSAPAGVVTVRIIVSASDMTNIQKDFPASDGQGQIDGVLAGSNRTVTAQGLDSSGNVTYQGSIGNITVVAGQTTDIGTITMLPTAFSQADLTGNWDSITFSPGTNSSNDANWSIESDTIDGQGNVTCTSKQDSNGATTCGSGSSVVVSIDSSGTVTGGDANFNGRMSLDKNLIVATTTELPDTFRLFVVRKRVPGVTYSSADVANTQFAGHTLYGGSNNIWNYGTGSTNASGQITLTSLNTPSGPGNLQINPATLQIDSNGNVTMAENSAFHGIMTPDKKVIFAVQTSLGVSPAEYEFIAFLVTGQTFTTADLAERREFHNIWDTGWGRGTSVTDTAGNQTYLSFLDSSGNSALPANDVQSITASGAITKSNNASYHAQRSFNKDLGVHTYTDANGHSRIGIGMNLLSPVLPSGFPSNVPTGNYRTDSSVCVAGNCFNGQSFTTSNTDISQFAQNLVNALNTAAAQEQASCNQSGVSCSFSISYTPWNGTSFTITDNFTVTTGTVTESGTITFTVTKI